MMAMTSESQESGRLGLVLSGGGARGAFQVGVLERLQRDERFKDGPAFVSGTSAGAINGALIAAGKSPREMMSFWNSLADDPPATASPEFFWSAFRTISSLASSEMLRSILPGHRWASLYQRAKNHVPLQRGSLLALAFEYILTSRFELISHFLEGVDTPYLATVGELRDRMCDALGGDMVPGDRVGLAINTVDANTGEVVRWVNRDSPKLRASNYNIVDSISVDMVLASASIPLLFPPVKIKDRQLWDGGLLVNTPLAPVVALGADQIVTILVTQEPDSQGAPLSNFGKAVERTIDTLLENAYNVDRKLLLERNHLARFESGPYREVALYEPIRPAPSGYFSAGSYLYFERDVLNAMRLAGRRAGNMWLKSGPRVDKLPDIASAA